MILTYSKNHCKGHRDEIALHPWFGLQFLVNYIFQKIAIQTMNRLLYLYFKLKN